MAPDEKAARQLAENNMREKEAKRGGLVTLEDVHTRIESGEMKALNLIIKTDVQGSIDAVRRSLDRLATDQARVNTVHAASGSITESDVLLAVASEAIIIGFNSQPEPGARILANQSGVEVRSYDIIYNLIDDVEKALKGLLGPRLQRRRRGARHGQGRLLRWQASQGGRHLCQRRPYNAGLDHPCAP